MWRRIEVILLGISLMLLGSVIIETGTITHWIVYFQAPVSEWVGWFIASGGFLFTLYGLFLRKKTVRRMSGYYVICTQCKNSFYGYGVKNNSCPDCGGLTVDMKGYQETFARMGIEEEPAQETLTDELTPNNPDRTDTLKDKANQKEHKAEKKGPAA